MTSPIPPTPLKLVRVGQYSDGELLEIAQNRKALSWTFLVCLVLQVAAVVWLPTSIFLPMSQIWLILIFPLCAMVSWLIVPTFIYGLASALKSPLKVFFAFISLVPGVGLIILLFLSIEATRVLRDRGLRVGLMGAKTEDVRRLTAELRESDPDYFNARVPFDYRARNVAAGAMQQTLVKVIVGLLLGWGAFHALGAYFLNHNPARAAVVFGFMLLFLGFWSLVWRMSNARIARREAEADEDDDEILLGRGDEDHSTT